MMERDKDMEEIEQKMREKQKNAKYFNRDIFRKPFEESGEVDILIAGLSETSKNTTDSEVAVQRFTGIMDLCQYQPTVIDSYLERLVSKLLNVGGKIDATPELQALAFKFLYLITKTKGAKIVVRHFPHNVRDVELVLALLAQPYLQHSPVWETKYVLLLWLSVACMIPIDLERLDGDLEDTKQTVTDRIMAIIKTYLLKADKTQDAACLLVSKALTRKDMVKTNLESFVNWCLHSLQTVDGKQNLGIGQQKGILTALAQLFKHGSREDMLLYAKRVFDALLPLNSTVKDNAALYKLAVKLLQRIGLTFLKPKLPKWRYQRGSRLLAENLSKVDVKSDAVKEMSRCTTNSSTVETLKPDVEEEEEGYDIPDEIETVIDVLLAALKDDNFIVRMSAAKGIGRVTNRLPQDLGDEVVGSILELFDIMNVDGRWHGGCLALAELCRRGLLLPSRLSDVIPVVMKSMLYEEKRGTNTYGSILRDAACYVCWSFARAFEPTDVQPHVADIAKGLVVAALFDREINVRKCAVAAFQENVGRQGTFPHGIDIVTTVDHFAVGNRKDTYLELSVYVAQFPEYTYELINHLAEVKMEHWDSAIRELTAQALENLTSRAPEYFCKTVLPRLLTKTMDKELNTRHGAILCVARIVYALSSIVKQQKRSIEEYLGKECLHAVKDIAIKIHDQKLFKGMEGELMRKAVCSLIEKASLSGLPYDSDPVIDLWETILHECLVHVDPGIQDCATMAVRPFYQQYFTDAEGVVITNKQERVVDHFLKELKAPSEVIRTGYSGAIGVLPRCMLSGHVTKILYGLIQSTKFTKREEKWVNARCSAIKAMTSICNTVGIDGHSDCRLTVSDIDEVYSCYLSALQDYTIDGRGEVGSLVRETSLNGILELTSLVVYKDPTLLQASVVEEIFKKCIHQACEKKDKTRECAGNVFIKLLYHEPPVPHIPHCEELKAIFTENDASNIRWSSPGDTFPKFARVIKLPTYTYSVLLGFAVCVGGLTEFIVKQASPSLHEFFISIGHKLSEVSRIAQVLLDIFRDYQKVDRVSIPLLKMLDQLLIRGYFRILEENDDHTFAKELVALVKTEISKSTDQQKLTASADVFCGLLLFKGEVRRKCLINLSIFLCHRYTQLRKYTAQRLHEVIDMFDIATGESLDEVLLLLGETIWENNDMAELKQTRNAICELLDIPIPVAVKKT